MRFPHFKQHHAVDENPLYQTHSFFGFFFPFFFFQAYRSVPALVSTRGHDRFKVYSKSANKVGGGAGTVQAQPCAGQEQPGREGKADKGTHPEDH